MTSLALLLLAAAPAESFKVVTVNKGVLAEQLAAHTQAAKKLKLRPFVEFTADWCKPCVAFKKYLHDKQMEDALSGVYLIQVDYDVISDADAKKAGFSMRGIPTFFELDSAGRPTGRTIASDVWGDDIPQNMAPPLKAFFAKAR